MAKNKCRSAFVPRLLVRTAIAGVIPACALACSSSDSGPATADTGIVSGVADAAYGDTHLGVTDSAYRDTPAGVADAAYGDSDTRFGVADTAYPDTSHAETSGDAPADAPSDASDGTSPDVFGVAAVAYPAYESGTPG